MRTLKEVRGMLQPRKNKGTKRSTDYKLVEPVYLAPRTLKDPATPSKKVMVLFSKKLFKDNAFRKRFSKAMENRLKRGYALPNEHDMRDIVEVICNDEKPIEDKAKRALRGKADKFMELIETMTVQASRPRIKKDEGIFLAPKAHREEYHEHVEDFLMSYVREAKKQKVFDEDPFILEVGAGTGHSLKKAKKEIKKMFPKASFLHTDIRKNPRAIYKNEEFLKHDILKEQFKLQKTPDIIVFTNVMMYMTNKKKAWENLLTATGKEKPTLLITGSSNAFGKHRHVVAGNKVIPTRMLGEMNHRQFRYELGEDGKMKATGYGPKIRYYLSIHPKKIAKLVKAAKQGITPNMRHRPYALKEETINKTIRKAKLIP